MINENQLKDSLKARCQAIKNLQVDGQLKSYSEGVLAGLEAAIKDIDALPKENPFIFGLTSGGGGIPDNIVGVCE